MIPEPTDEEAVQDLTAASLIIRVVRHLQESGSPVAAVDLMRLLQGPTGYEVPPRARQHTHTDTEKLIELFKTGGGKFVVPPEASHASRRILVPMHGPEDLHPVDALDLKRIGLRLLRGGSVLESAPLEAAQFFFLAVQYDLVEWRASSPITVQDITVRLATIRVPELDPHRSVDLDDRWEMQQAIIAKRLNGYASLIRQWLFAVPLSLYVWARSAEPSNIAVVEVDDDSFSFVEQKHYGA